MALRRDLLNWQRKDYSRVHRNRWNLVLHLLGVPLFWLGTFALLWGVFTGQPAQILAGLGAMAIGFGIQGFGHSREAPSVPFDGVADALSRIFVEQFITFPRYSFSGELLQVWRSSRP